MELIHVSCRKVGGDKDRVFICLAGDAKKKIFGSAYVVVRTVKFTAKSKIKIKEESKLLMS